MINICKIYDNYILSCMHRYNLQPLMNKDFTVQNASSIIKLRVCGMLTDSACKTGTGIYFLPIAYIIIIE